MGLLTSRSLSIIFFLTFVFFFASVSAQEHKVKVMSYNIHIGNPPSQPGVTNLPRIAQVINDSDADLVALQEVDVYTNRSGKDLDQAKELAKLTDRHYYYVKTIDHDGGEYGIAILSKFPILKKEHHLLPTAEGVRSEQRAVAIVTVEPQEGQYLDFATTHFDLTSETRVLQAKFINELFKGRKIPVILGGDFNAVSNSAEIRLLDEYFTRSTIPNGYTIPVVQPVKEIDYIMVFPKSQFKVDRHVVVQEHFASDHLPVFVEFTFTPSLLDAK